MNKKIKNLFLAGAVLVGLAGVSVSCTDYSKDIDELRDENAALSKTVTELQEKLKSGISITSVTPTTGGFVIVFSDNQTYTIANGQSGTSGKDGSDGKDGADGKDGKDGGYYTPGADGYWYFHKDSTDTAGTKTEIKCLPSGTGSVTAELSADGRTLTLKGVTGADGDIVLNLKSDLTSLVFVPDLYVDGIESAEYLYAKYDVQKLGLENTGKKAGEVLDGEYTYYVDGVTTTTAHVLNGYWKFSADAAASGSKAKFLNPASSVITYKMNPSSADVNASTPLEFISRDAVSRSSVQAPEAKFIGTENGELKVGLSAKGLEQVLTRAQQSAYAEADKICVFALQATVAGSNGKDTTVTSDFARLVTEKLTFNHLAIKSSSEDISLYTSIENVFKNAPSVTVKYDGSVDLADYVTTHFYVGGASGTCYDYATEYPDNDYKVTYEFEGVDYLVGDNVTSETQHMYLDGSVLTPCGVTDAGLHDSGKAAGREAVGRCPVVRVVMKVDGNIVLVGFVKVEIVTEAADDKVAEPFGDWTYRFVPDGYSNVSTWAQMENKVIAISGLSKAEFVTTYELAENTAGLFNGEVIQYIRTAKGFEPLPYLASSGVTTNPYGEVTEKRDGTSGAATDVIEWEISADDMSRIYALDGHKVTIWVKFTPRNTAVKYGDIYVPLTAVVDKPVATVSKALDVWYNNGAYAVFSVKEPTSSTEVLSTDWKSNLNSVWSGGVPTFDFGTDYNRLLTGAVSYQYYFAPEQPRFVIGAYTYQLHAVNSWDDSNSTKLKTLDGNYIPKIGSATNDAIKDYVLANGIVVYDGNEAVSPGLFGNDKLYCARIQTSEATADWTRWSDLGGTDEKIAWINYGANPGEFYVQYNNASETAKALLNAYPSLKSDRSDAALYANIGVVPFFKHTHGLGAADYYNVALSVDGAINEFHFLRPINVTGVADADHVFTDGTSSSLDLFDLFKFTDWRGKDFCEEKNEGTAEAPSYTYPNLYLYKYYGIKSVWADLCCATTDYNGGTLGTSKLSAQTGDIVLEYKEYPSAWTWVKKDQNGKTHHSEFTLTNDWTNSQDALRNLFLGITYKNAGAIVASSFKIRIPVTFTYTWGEVSSYVDVTVKPSNNN